MKEKLTHEQAQEQMLNFLYDNLIADKRKRKKGEIEVAINNQEFVIIAPVERKAQPSLEKRMGDNTEKGIATVCVFPESSSVYDGKYSRNPKKIKYSEDGVSRYHNCVNLSSVEQFLYDDKNNLREILYHYDVRSKIIKKSRYKKLPMWFFTQKFGIELTDEDEMPRLLKCGAVLKTEYGKGYTSILTPADRQKYISLRKILREREKFREKLGTQVVTKGEYTLEVIKTPKGILIGKINQYIF